MSNAAENITSPSRAFMVQQAVLTVATGAFPMTASEEGSAAAVRELALCPSLFQRLIAREFRKLTSKYGAPA